MALDRGQKILEDYCPGGFCFRRMHWRRGITSGAIFSSESSMLDSGISFVAIRKKYTRFIDHYLVWGFV